MALLAELMYSGVPELHGHLELFELWPQQGKQPIHCPAELQAVLATLPTSVLMLGFFAFEL